MPEQTANGIKCVVNKNLNEYGFRIKKNKIHKFQRMQTQIYCILGTFSLESNIWNIFIQRI